MTNELRNTPDWMVLQIDFSKFDGVNIQVLFIVVWYVGSDADSHVAHRVFLCNDQSNDTSFTIVSLLSLFKDGRLPAVTEALERCHFLFVWADGGPKHFGNTAFIDSLLGLQSILRGNADRLSACAELRVLYFKFIANHGYGPCDGMAANGKRAVASVQRNGEMQVNTSAELGEVLDGVGDWEASSSPVATASGKETRRPRTWHGFRKFHVFGVEQQQLSAWHSAEEYFAEETNNEASTIRPTTAPSMTPWLIPFNLALEHFHLRPYTLPTPESTTAKAKRATHTDDDD